MLATSCIYSPSGNQNNGNTDTDGENTPNDENKDENLSDNDNNSNNTEVEDPTKLSLISEQKANFKIVYTSASGGDGARVANKLAQQLRKLNVIVDDPVRDTNATAVSECEIIIGCNAKNRPAACSISDRYLGAEGYVIQVIGDRVVIAAGTPSLTASVFSDFVEQTFGITDDTNSLRSLSIDRLYYSEKLTEYKIESVNISGIDLSKYTLVYDLDGIGNFNKSDIESFREDLFDASGYWLEQSNTDSLDSIDNAFIIRMVTDAGADGFRAYVSENDFLVECAYANAFNKSFVKFADSCFFSKSGKVDIENGYTYTDNVSIARYCDFGAVGDGETDDFAAILKTHIYANQCGQKVLAEENAEYYISPDSFTKTIPIKTNVDFNGATFYIDDRGSNAYKYRSLTLFTTERDSSAVTYSGSNIESEFGNVSLRENDTSISWLVGHIDVQSLVRVVNSNKKDYIRYGANENSGADRTDVFLVNPDGTLSDGTAVVFNFDNITEITVWRADDASITIENGVFYNICNVTLSETDYKIEYKGYSRGFKLQRSNVTVSNITHRMMGEPDLDTDYDEAAALYGSRRESYPYNKGFLYIDETNNLLVTDCSLTGRTMYFYESTSSNGDVSYVRSGSYDFVIEYSTNVTLRGVTQYNDKGTGLGDMRYYGIMASSFSKNIVLDKCELNRFDAHQGAWNVRITDSIMGHTLNVIGGGELYLENVTRISGQSFINLRDDYGASFRGNIVMKNCTHRAHPTYFSYRGESLDTSTSYSIGYIIHSGYDSDSSEYGTWNFGYTCYMPITVTLIENFTSYSKATYLYEDISDAAFTDYGYVLTEKLILQDYVGDNIPVCRNSSSYMFKNVDVIEQ